MVINKTKHVWFLRTDVPTGEASHKMVWYKMDNEINVFNQIFLVDICDLADLDILVY